MEKSIIFIELNINIDTFIDELEKQFSSTSKYPTVEEKNLIYSLNKDTTNLHFRLLQTDDMNTIITLSLNKKIENEDIKILENKIKKALKNEITYKVEGIYIDYYKVTRSNVLGESKEKTKGEVYF